MDLISVIIPIYNNEQTLAQCLDSILAQTYSNLEIILINDGSQDNSGDIALDFANISPNIKIFSQSNAGVAAARNLGLEHFSGKYVLFVDADDTIEPTYIQELYNSLVNAKAELAICGYNKIGRKTESIIPRGKLSRNIFQDFLILKDVVFFIACKLYSGDILRKYDIKFDSKYLIAEDQFFNRKYYEYVEKYSFVDKALYNYFQYGDSLSTNLSVEFFQQDYKNVLANVEFYNKFNVKGGEILISHAQTYLLLKYFHPNTNKYSINKDIFNKIWELSHPEWEFMYKIIKQKALADFIMKQKWYWPIFIKLYQKHQRKKYKTNYK